MPVPRYDWRVAYDYQRRVASLMAGEAGLFRCTPAHSRHLASVIRKWVARNPDKFSVAGIESVLTVRRGLLVVIGGAVPGYLDREPDHTWMPRIATYLPD